MSNSRSLIPASPVFPKVSLAEMAPAAGQLRLSQGQVLPASLVQQNTALLAQNVALKLALAQERTRTGGPPRPAMSADRAPQPAPLAPPLQQTAAGAPRAANHHPGLTLRQLQVMALVLTGHPSKTIAADLGISQRTVENHRAAIMRRTGATSLPALARLAIGASHDGDCRADSPPCSLAAAPD